MKKIISTLLAALTAASGLTAFGTTTAAAAETNPPVYLWGDVNLDGSITIADATELQRALAELSEMDGLQTALAQFDSAPPTIQTATHIQQYLAETDTGFPIGQPAGDETEGVVYAQQVMSHTAMYGQVVSQTDKVMLSTAYPDVAFISDKEAVQAFITFAGYQPNDLVISTNENSHSFTLPNGTTVVFDYANKLLAFSDYSTFTTPKGAVPFNPYGNTFPAALTLFQTQPETRYFGGDPRIVTFDYDEVPMLQKGGDFLIPLQTFCDFFMTAIGYFVQYNGKAVYIMPPGAADSMPDFWKRYRDDTEKREQISDALAQVNYYELCNILEARYGLRQAHNIESFDTYFNRRGLREEFLSGDVRRIENANNMLGTLLFEDFHSGSNSTSPFFSGTDDSLDRISSPVFDNRIANNEALVSKRTAMLGKTPAPYERRGDTVFITFDDFTFSDPNRYYQDDFVLTPNPNDTIELFAYALNRLQNEDSDAKNVVVDLACNGGGTAVSCGFAMEALIGKCIICLQNPNTSALSQNVMKFDLNLDGSIDKNDVSVKAMGKNIAVVISDNSFSCGNLLPCSLNALDPNVLLLGQQSGGGSCSVGYISNAIGSTMQISSEKMLVTMKNGYIRDIDNGAAPHIPMSSNKLFDRDYLANVVSEYFG